ncbi:MAG: hypothetical protein ABIQ57_14905 [Candidatus Kapaibacterium sp.]
MKFSRYLLCLLMLVLSACTPPPQVVNYAVSSESPFVCCRTIRYSTWNFTNLRASSVPGDSVVVLLIGGDIPARCENGAEVGIEVANNSARDIYIPISNELEGENIKLYPWRLFYVSGGPVRVARQIQYNDLVEREDARLRFFRLPKGKEVVLRGIIPQRWLCSTPTEVPEYYLQAELNPTLYSDRSKELRAASYQRDPKLGDSLRLRYDISYTTLNYLDALPVKERKWNAARDSVEITVGMKDDIGDVLVASQQLVKSNVITVRIAN